MNNSNLSFYYTEASWQKFIKDFKVTFNKDSKNENIKLEFDIDIPDNLKQILILIFREKAIDFLNNPLPVFNKNCAKDLLTGKSSIVNSIEEGEKWVKVAIMRGVNKGVY
jgi:hypothetical protein